MSGPGTGKTIPPEELQSIGRILLIQYKPFGDVLLNTGYMPELRRHFPEARIDFLVQEPYRTVLVDNPWLDDLLPMRKLKRDTIPYLRERLRVVRMVRSRGYHVVVDMLRGPGSAQITLFSGARYRLGWRLRRWNWVYNYQVKRDNQRYYARSKFDLLAPLGIREVPHGLYYRVRPESQEYVGRWLRREGLDHGRMVTISPASPLARKQWRPECFSKLGDMIVRRLERPVVLLWGPGERELSELVAEGMETRPYLAPPTSFNQAGAMLRRSAAYAGNDGGINHLAVAMETPSVAVFGPTSNPRKWTAWHLPRHAFLRNWEHHDPTDTTFGVAPEEVLEKLAEVLEA
ncbi:MAG: glycosyltransferase family 9 protein [Candidatus Fermentibacteraceae bacterium]